ncbi:hypothetical protein N9251_00690 [Gammaproteobacteria bacterium]|nr:hypothetical protein [Gammaproteobacteria bacterium]
MSENNIDRKLIKSWFEAGDQPTEEQFHNWIENCLYKFDSIKSLLNSSDIANSSDLGVVKSSNQVNEISVNSDGIMNINSISSDKILGLAQYKLKFEEINASFIAQWNHRCRKDTDKEYGRYNSNTGFFECNNILDIDFDEALSMWEMMGTIKNKLPIYYTETRFRTTLALAGNTIQELEFYSVGFYRSTFSSIRLTTDQVQLKKEAATCFTYYTRNVQEIYGEVIFISKPKLIDLRGLQHFRFIIGNTPNSTFDFELPRVIDPAFDSIDFLIRNWGNTINPLIESQTLSLHLQVYDKITNSGNLDYTIWHSLGLLASNKNIIIALT